MILEEMIAEDYPNRKHWHLCDYCFKLVTEGDGAWCSEECELAEAKSWRDAGKVADTASPFGDWRIGDFIRAWLAFGLTAAETADNIGKLDASRFKETAAKMRKLSDDEFKYYSLIVEAINEAVRTKMAALGL
jgi:hypothetical protein